MKDIGQPVSGLKTGGESYQSRLSRKLIKTLSLDDQVRFESYSVGQVDSPTHQLLHHAFEYYAQVQPDVVAVEHEGSKITYGELNRQATRLSAILQYQGVKQGDCVGLFLRRSIYMVVGIFAVLKLGASYVPQDVKISPENQLNSVLRQAEINVVLTASGYRDSIPAKKNTLILNIDQLTSENASERLETIPLADLSPDTLCFVLFTSGTTGEPNGVQVTHRNVSNIILTKPGNLGIGPGTRVAQLLNIAFDMAAWEILGCLCNGGTLLIRSSDFTETASRADVLIATPSVLSGIDADQCSGVKTVAVAGEPCPKPLADRWSAFCNFYNSCGPTETTIVNTMKLYDPDKGELTIGAPVPNTTVYVLDDALNPLPIGETGEMWAGGACVTQGYMGNEVLTADRYRPDPFLGGEHMMFRTRDLGRWTETGELEHLGRVDDQVKVKGFRVELDAVTTVIEKAPGCKRAVTLKYDDDHLVAFVSPKTADIHAVYDAIDASLPYYCKPKTIIALDELPVTPRGKVDKRLLMELAQNKNNNGTETMTDTAGTILDEREPIVEKRPGLYRRITANPRYSQYYRLAALIVLTNLGLLGWGIYEGTLFNGTAAGIELLSTLAVANFAIGILARSQYVINFLFWLATRPSTRWPLSIRWACGKVFHHGGVHIGGNVAGTMWFTLFTGTLAWHTWQGLPGGSVEALQACGVLVGLLFAILLTAYAPNRMKRHDLFERMHRFGGWTALVLFWVVTVMFVDGLRGETPLAAALAQSTGFWLLCAITASIVAPWLYLKRVPIEVVKPSSHAAIVQFNYGDDAFPGSSNALSRNPLLEWHSFATIPTPGEDGFRMIISRAGDWTGRFIDDTPSHVWIKGITTSGVARIEVLFKRVVYVATGSGIGPVMPHLLAQDVPIHLIWATRNPEKTYGEDLCGEIRSVNPDANIWDTDAYGKPDLVEMAHEAVKSFDAEAVIVISNQKVTRNIVEQMEQRGIPAFGAIWDS